MREFSGHRIETVYHDEPQVLYVGRPGTSLVLEPGMIFTVEPMLNAGKPGTKQLADGWAVVKKDRSLFAQWEYRAAVTESGFEILTYSPAGLSHPNPPVERHLARAVSEEIEQQTGPGQVSWPRVWIDECLDDGDHAQ